MKIYRDLEGCSSAMGSGYSTTIAGLDAARARGKKGGRPSGLSKEAQAKAHSAELIYKEGKLSVSEICNQLSICRATFYKYLKFRGASISVEHYRIKSKHQIITI
jgi:DNA invertase Pin-like site-specific DNA recombinase